MTKNQDQPEDVAATPTSVVVEGRPLESATPDAAGDRDIDQPGGKLGVDGDPNLGGRYVDPDATTDAKPLAPEEGGPSRYGPGPLEGKSHDEVSK